LAEYQLSAGSAASAIREIFMRLSASAFVSATILLLAGSAMAQPAGGTMGGSMSGGSMNNGGGMQMNAQGGVGVFSRENMAMMIVDREKATKGMTADQAAAARKDEMAKHGSETPAETQARRATYDSEWLKLTAAEKSDALTKLDAQMKARGMMAPAPASK
jgi:hypothetical protein